MYTGAPEKCLEVFALTKETASNSSAQNNSSTPRWKKKNKNPTKT